MATRRTIAAPAVQQYYQRVPQPVTRRTLSLEHALVAPWYQVVRSMADGDVVPEAQLTFMGQEGAADTAAYTSSYYMADPFVAQAPGILEGAALDTAWSSVLIASGDGDSQDRHVLTAESTETVLLNRTTAEVVLGANDSFDPAPACALGVSRRTCKFPNVDFNVLLAAYTLPETYAVDPAASPVEPNYLTDPQHLCVIFNPTSELTATRHLRVLGISPTDADTLIVEDDKFVAAGTQAAKLILNPAQVTLSATAVKASKPLFVGQTLDATAIATLGGAGATTVMYNFDEVNAWTLTISNTGGPLEATFAAAGNEILLELAAVPGDNTVAAVNAAIAALFYTKSRIHNRARVVPVQFYPVPAATSWFVAAPFPGPAAADTAAALTGVTHGFVRAKTAGAAANDYRVTLQLGGAAGPTCERVGDHWIITLHSGLVQNTGTAINALLAANGDLIELVDEAGAVLLVGDIVNQFSLGTLADHAGYQAVRVDPNNQTGYLRNGADAGNVYIPGGLVPTYTVGVASEPFYTYMEYRALRVDKSPGASENGTGNRPDFTEVTRDTFEDIVGEITVDNPMGIVAYEFFQTSNNRRGYLLSPSAVSDDYPWGTATAVDEVLTFAQKRDLYHIHVHNDARWMCSKLKDWADSLGGTETVPLKRPQDFYIPVKTPSESYDLQVVAGSGSGTTTTFTANVNFTSYIDDPTTDTFVLVFTSETLDPTVIDGVTAFTLQDGRKGYKISTLSTGGSPYAVTLAVALSSAATSDSFAVYKMGESLYTGTVFDSAAAAEAMYDWHSFSAHKRLMKHLCNRYESLIDGTYTILDGVYALAKYAGIVANSPDHLPTSTRAYANTRRVEGTSDIFTQDELQILAGAGLTMPVSRGGTGDGQVNVFRDVSSDTSTRVFQRRSAGVTEDKISIMIERIIKPRLGPNLVTESMVDTIARDLSRMEDMVRDAQWMKVFTFKNVIPINDEIRALFGTEDSGVLVETEMQHYEELALAIVRHVVNP